ncbi:MAG: glycoside hydrolase, partial [Bacteroidaceae bacterium]|nr:glycoside hydrolase [Bacteroidaceae bacterium]
LDPVAWKKYFDTYFDMYKDAAGGLMGEKGIQYVLTDSYEAGAETWTPAMLTEFKARRGYDMLPWMPVLTGQIIGSAEASEKFLWDWRKTHSELIAENYDRLTAFAKERGMKGRYSEAHENGRLYLVDGMDVKRTATYPMSAIWCYMVNSGGGSSLPMAEADIKESSSVAHIYGQNVAAAESMTAIGLGTNLAWNFYPRNLKQVADTELANGLNLFVIHESAHQPLDDKQPGLGLMIFGQWFNRHETWANHANVWMDYLGRSSYMLRQGHYVADVLYYYGEDNNITGLFGDYGNPVMPQGYSFDYLNADALTRLVEVKDGRLTTPSGMSYRILYLDKNVKTMSMPVLRKLAELAEQGAVICGYRPQQPASLADDALEFNALVDKIWNSGRKNVYFTAMEIEKVLKAEGVAPDFLYDTARIPEMRYVHRTTADSEIYWVNKHDDQTVTTEVSFRVTGKVPEIWHPDNGQVERADYREVNGRTLVTLHLVPDDAVFVVFKQNATHQVLATTRAITQGGEEIPVEGAWEVSFQAQRGAPEKATFNELKSFTEQTDSGIKYFSGEAVYSKTLTINKKQFANHQNFVLDLGEVGVMAEVIVNGQNLGVVWKQPYLVDVTSALKAGDNQLTVKVINPWVNRLIGDAQPGAEKLTYTSMPFYQANSPLVPSGLMGPVKIIAE